MVKRLAHVVLVTLVVTLVACGALQAALQPLIDVLQIDAVSADLGLVQIEITLK